MNVIRCDELERRERYQLLTSLVVPRPIGWLSTESRQGIPNLAPFSYFTALADTPMLLGVSIGHRRDGPKDSLVNIRETHAFCVNVVTVPFLEAMNLSSGDHPAEINEFELAGLPMARATTVSAPYVATCPAVMECRLFREFDLGRARNTLVIGEVLAARVSSELAWVPGTRYVDSASLRPVGRLWGGAYMMPGEIRVIPRPVVER